MVHRDSKGLAVSRKYSQPHGRLRVTWDYFLVADALTPYQRGSDASLPAREHGSQRRNWRKEGVVKRVQLATAHIGTSSLGQIAEVVALAVVGASATSGQFSDVGCIEALPKAGCDAPPSARMATL